MTAAKPLIWDEEEQTLAEGARAWVDAEHPVSRFRALRDAGRTWDRALWTELVELGWPAVGLAEDAGGMGLAARVAICEALGRGLVGTPLISAWLAADLDPEADAEAGEVRALAWEEPASRADPHRVTAHVHQGRLTGSKVNVLDPGAATSWLVTAREGGAIGLYRVALDAARVQPLARIDHRDAANLAFEAAPAVRIAELPPVLAALNQATIAQAAELLGGANAAFEMTLAYVKERTQFDVPIGSFQVVQHRLVDCFVQLELARSAVMAAAREPTPDHTSLAKALCGDAALQVAREAIQFHGGIGVTDEHDIGLFFKRARVADRLYGTAAHHRSRWAQAGV